MADFRREEWISDLQEILVPKNDFLTFSVNHTQYVLNDAVNVPQEGELPGGVMGRSEYPATVTRRTDKNLKYFLKDFSTNPTHLPKIESDTFTYDKRVSILSGHRKTQYQNVARYVLQNWADGVDVIRTTGAAASDAVIAGTTGTRKAITADDVKALAQKFDEQDIPEEGRYLLLPTPMYHQLMNDEKVINSLYIGRTVITGTEIPPIHGFTILKRNGVLKYNTNGGLKAFEAAVAATDCLGGLAWQKDMVATAMGTIDVLMNEKDALYYGDVISTMLYFGASRLREDKKGVCAIVQAN